MQLFFIAFHAAYLQAALNKFGTLIAMSTMAQHYLGNTTHSLAGD